MLKRKEAAKFFCGFETFHVFIHAYLLATASTLTVFGITTTPALNTISIAVNVVIAMLLGVYGWKRPTPKQSVKLPHRHRRRLSNESWKC